MMVLAARRPVCGEFGETVVPGHGRRIVFVSVQVGRIQRLRFEGVIVDICRLGRWLRRRNDYCRDYFCCNISTSVDGKCREAKSGWPHVWSPGMSKINGVELQIAGPGPGCSSVVRWRTARNKGRSGKIRSDWIHEAFNEKKSSC